MVGYTATPLHRTYIPLFICSSALSIHTNTHHYIKTKQVPDTRYESNSNKNCLVNSSLVASDTMLTGTYLTNITDDTATYLSRIYAAKVSGIGLATK
jgi:hypothetical protein